MFMCQKAIQHREPPAHHMASVQEVEKLRKFFFKNVKLFLCTGSASPQHSPNRAPYQIPHSRMGLEQERGEQELPY